GQAERSNRISAFLSADIDGFCPIGIQQLGQPIGQLRSVRLSLHPLSVPARLRILLCTVRIIETAHAQIGSTLRISVNPCSSTHRTAAIEFRRRSGEFLARIVEPDAVEEHDEVDCTLAFAATAAAVEDLILGVDAESIIATTARARSSELNSG